MQKVLIVYGGPSAEHEVSISTAKSMLRNLSKKKYQISLLPISKDLTTEIISNPLDIIIPTNKKALHIYEIIKKLKKFDILLLATHGKFGEDGTLQSILETENIKFSGSGSYASRLSMDKYRSSLIVSTLPSVNIPDTFLIQDKSNLLADIKKYLKKYEKIVLKPNALGSSVATYFIDQNSHSQKDINVICKYISMNFTNEDFIIQEAITPSIEISCGFLEKKDKSGVLLPPTEIQPVINTFYDYDSKYQQNGSTHLCPPQSINQSTINKTSKLAKEIHKLLGCSTYSRSDFLIKDDRIFYLETNTLPGMTPTSLLPEQAKVAGLNFKQLLNFIIKNS